MNIKGFLAPLKAYIARHRRVSVAVLLIVVLAAAFFIPRPQHSSPGEQERLRPIQEAPTPEALLPEPPQMPETPMPEHPRVSIVIDDVGMEEEATAQAIALPPEVTLSFFPYAPDVQRKVNAARAAGHEVFMHVPMQAINGEDPGPHALTVDMDDDTLKAEIEKNLSSFTGYVGVNNHMGSRFTADERGMRLFLGLLKPRGVIFLDSRTNAATKGEAMARAMGIKTMRRHVFLDNEQTGETILNQLAETRKMADKQGFAIAIGHPHAITLDILATNLVSLRDRYELVPVSALAK